MRRLWLVGLVALLSGSIDPQQFECEEAVAHIEDCCGAKPDIQCGAGCDSVDLSLANATCLSKASCDALKNAGVCDQPTKAVCE